MLKRSVTALAATAMVFTGAAYAPPALAGDTEAVDPLDPAGRSGGCATARQVRYDVVAINVDIPVNRWGERERFGFMYALESQVPAIRAAERAGSVSAGLRGDAIQPLTLRARLGDCVVISLRNGLTAPPRDRAGIQPGGVPAVSVDVSGAAYQTNEGGHPVGNNLDRLVRPGDPPRQYRFYLDPLVGEGAKVFHSGGDSALLTAHGLFGTIVAEPVGARWFDPRTGAETTDDQGWTSWDAMVLPFGEPAFREFVLAYHDFGLNYRREPVQRRLAALGEVYAGLPADRLLGLVDGARSLGYSSYTFGDPATPMPASYLGEPAKTRLVHAGTDRARVHHLHGGGDRWRANPDADDPTEMVGGLNKSPDGDARSVRLDTEVLGPDESQTLEHECGAGGCQQAPGDYLFGDTGQRGAAGDWGLWRVFDTDQGAALAPLPGSTRPAAAVPSGQLVGRTVEGRTIVPDSAIPGVDEVRLADWVESQLPPRGVPLAPDDATVWNYARSGDTYLGEPETAARWANYRAAAPGRRPVIGFSPLTGRYAWPLFRPHLGQRPPFSGAGHTGAPWTGEDVTPARPDGMCPRPPRPQTSFAVVAGTENLTLAGPVGGGPVGGGSTGGGLTGGEPLTIRSNVGDCVEVTLTNERPAGPDGKAGLHAHLVQFDPQASDGVTGGFSYEQSVASYRQEGVNRSGRRLPAAVPAGARQVPLADTGELRPGVYVGVGLGTSGVEVRRITAVGDGTLTLDRPLDRPHRAGEFAGVEFVRYRWYSDADTGTAFLGDQTTGLFGALVVEPAGSTYLDPATGRPIRSGTQAVIATTGRVGADHPGGSFREFTLFLRGEGCAGSSVNLRSEPLAERSDPALLRRLPGTAALAGCQDALTTADPYAFSSGPHGDPATPLLRAYPGDPVVVRAVGVGEGVRALRVSGHRFRPERLNPFGGLTDTAALGGSQRVDAVLAGGAGEPRDYLYHDAAGSGPAGGGWGILRVHGRIQPDLPPLPGRGLARVAPRLPACPAGAPVRRYDVSLVDLRVPGAEPAARVTYALTQDVERIAANPASAEPLVLRANEGECVRVLLRNRTGPASGPRASFDLARSASTSRTGPAANGGAVGRNPDTTVGRGQSRLYEFLADRGLGTAVFTNSASPATVHAGGYGMVVVEPVAARWFDSETGERLDNAVDQRGFNDRTATEAVIRSAFGTDNVREFVLAVGSPVPGVGWANYHAESVPARLALGGQDHAAAYLNDAAHGDPRTPILRAYTGDRTVIRVGVPAATRLHAFTVAGHAFPGEPAMWDDRSDNRSRVHSVGPLWAGQSLDVELVGGAGTRVRGVGDYMYGDARAPLRRAGLWGLLRVLPRDASSGPARL